MKTVAIIQARMGSTRLPGKVMIPLDGTTTLDHVINRVCAADCIDETVVATSEQNCDTVIARTAARAGAAVARGSESDVVRRIYDAATSHSADVVVRVTADSPLIPVAVIETLVRRVNEGLDYITTGTGEKTLPLGYGAEAFTMNSFQNVHSEATADHHREHVTTYYKDHPDQFEIRSISSKNIFDDPSLHNRGELRLTLDEPDDYEILRRLFKGLDYDEYPDAAAAIQYVCRNNLHEINATVTQKSPIQSEEK